MRSPERTVKAFVNTTIVVNWSVHRRNLKDEMSLDEVKVFCYSHLSSSCPKITLPRQFETPMMLRRRLLSLLLRPPNWIALSGEKEKKEEMPRLRRKWERRRRSMEGEERMEMYKFHNSFFFASSVSSAAQSTFAASSLQRLF